MVQILMGNFIIQRFGKLLTDEKTIIIDLKNSSINIKNCIHVTCDARNGKYLKSSYDLYKYLNENILHSKHVDLLTSNQILKRMSQINFLSNKQDVVELPTIEQAIQFSIHLIKQVLSQNIVGSQIQFFIDGFDPIFQLVQVFQNVFSGYIQQYFVFLRSWVCTGWLEHTNLANNLRIAKQVVIIPFYAWSDVWVEQQLLSHIKALNCNYQFFFKRDKIIFADFCFQKKNFVSKTINISSFLLNVLENVKKHSYKVGIDKCWAVVPKLLDDIALQHVERQVIKLTQQFVIQDEISDFTSGVILLFTGQQIEEMQEFLEFKVQDFVNQ